MRWGRDIRYILSRVYLHIPPPEHPTHVSLPPSRQHSYDLEGKRSRGEEEEPQANPWVVIVVLVLAIGLMAGTTEWVSILRLWRSWSD